MRCNLKLCMGSTSSVHEGQTQLAGRLEVEGRIGVCARGATRRQRGPFNTIDAERAFRALMEWNLRIEVSACACFTDARIVRRIKRCRLSVRVLNACLNSGLRAFKRYARGSSMFDSMRMSH